MKFSFKTLFNEKPEDSAALRYLALGATWSTGFALAVVGASAWVGVGGPALATIGHYWSWKTRNRKLGLWRVGLMVGVIILMAIMATQVQGALHGNWLPPTVALVLVQSIASFDIRTRSNVSTSFLVSAIILILASQLAFTSLFILPLAAYLGLLFAYLAASAAIDGRSGTITALAWSRRSQVMAWAGWTAALVGLGVVLFLVLPWGTVHVKANVAFSAMLPVTGDMSEEDKFGESSEESGQGAQTGEPADGAGANATTEGREGTAAGSSAANAAPPRPTAGNPAASDEVLRVRSPVASYWRTRIHVTQDGLNWSVQSAPVEVSSQGRVNTYTQTVYVAQGQSAPALGYAPVDWAMLTEKGGADTLNRGAIYQVQSERRSYDPETLRFYSGRAFIRSQRVSRLPPRIAALAREISGGSQDVHERSQAITTYLSRNFTLARDAPKDRPSKSTEDFLFDGARSGGSFDFAAAETLLALGAGLDARVATGYLPGQFDPLSGAYIVRERDAHAWVEIRYPGVGWVPFDPSPSPDVQRRQAKPGAGAQFFGKLFDVQFGDDVRGDLGAFFSSMTLGRIAAVAGACSVLFSAIGLWYFLQRKRRLRVREASHTLLRDAERKEVLEAWRRLQRHLRRRGVAPMGRAETLTAYVTRASAAAPDARPALEGLQAQIARAAYSPAPLGPGEGRQAKAALARIAASA
ncbi:MAG: DUF4129 domain-containing protein [Chloroflexi bacterium]|nr:DUF4129 domain-containing protein [Chloroflexota bacterium]